MRRFAFHSAAFLLVIAIAVPGFGQTGTPDPAAAGARTGTPAAGSTPAADDVTDETYQCRGHACELKVSWAVLEEKGGLILDEKYVAAKGQPRTDSNTTVTIRLTGFNYLRYQPKFTVKETEVAAYVTLEKLWQQIFVLARAFQAAAVADSVNQAFLNWRDQIRLTNGDLDVLTAGSGQVGFVKGGSEVVLDVTWRDRVALLKMHVATILSYRDDGIPFRRDQLERARAAARDALASASQSAELIRLYEDTLRLHESTIDRLGAFARLASRVVDGGTKTIAAKDAGRFITVTIAPTDTDGAERPSQSIEYFVHSNLPVAFHSGYSYGLLKDIDYEKVRTASGQDLYAEIKKSDKTTALVTFLSYDLAQLAGAKGARVPLFATLGTDLGDPGKRLYLGGSTGYKKLFITLGAMSTSVAEPSNTVVDQVVSASGQVLGTRELFKTLSSNRKYKFFFSVSFNPFGSW